MSVRVVNAVNNGTVTPNVIPCLGGGGNVEASKFPQSGVRDKESLQIRFAGKPPYNLTQTVCDNNRARSYCYCGLTTTRLESSTFNWTVDSFTFNWTDTRNQTLTVFTPTDGYSLIWTAIEWNTSVVMNTPYYSSPNFTISATSYDNPKSKATTQGVVPGKMGVIGLGMLTLSLIGLLLDS